MTGTAGRDGNVDPAELAKFDRLAARWWDPLGPQRPLHVLNPVRLGYIREHIDLVGADLLDVGCGGGLLSEALAAAGAQVTALDLAPEALDVARLHLLESGLSVDYRRQSVEALAIERPTSFDAVTCMEMLEHVPDPGAVIAACAALLRPGGRLFLSTVNRTAKAFLLAIVGAEYLAGLLPRGTHSYERFIRPSELAAWLRSAGLVVEDVTGVGYDPLRQRAALGASTAVNYLVRAHRPT